MPKGIISINKERGISSARVVSLLRKALGMKKIGHTGTLDLEASGLLCLLVGKATRVSDYMMDKDKTYQTDLIFGKKTDTLDGAGKVIKESDKVISKEDLEKVLNEFVGETYQIPPMYSALKQNGKKLYELARSGIEVKRKKRLIKIYGIDLIDFDFPKATILVKCSKGTYIRTLVDDIGDKLETYAYADNLIRLKVGEFSIKDSIKSQDILTIGKDKLIENLYPIDTALKNFERIDLSKSYLKKLVNGQSIKIDSFKEGVLRVYSGGHFLGLGEILKKDERNYLKMKKVFYDRED